MTDSPDHKGGAAVLPMQNSPRCGAKTRNGSPCEAPAVHGKKRCRMHGGAAGSGAPKGNRNAYKHGDYSRATLELKKSIAVLTRRARYLMRQF